MIARQTGLAFAAAVTGSVFFAHSAHKVAAYLMILTVLAVKMCVRRTSA